MTVCIFMYLRKFNRLPISIYQHKFLFYFILSVNIRLGGNTTKEIKSYIDEIFGSLIFHYCYFDCGERGRKRQVSIGALGSLHGSHRKVERK